MKIYIYGLLVIFSFACTTTRVVHNNPGKNNITGSWKLTGLTHTGSEVAEGTPLFDIVNVSCLEESVWNFNNDKTSGTIVLDGPDCEKRFRKIHWLIYEPGDGTVNFQFKYVATGDETPNKEGKGFQTNIDRMDASTMVMQTSSGKDSMSSTTLTFSKVPQ
jgi:hypothetical protein